MKWSYLGLVPYGAALELQRRLAEERRNGGGADILLLLQHPPVVTLGVRGQDSNVLVPPDELARAGIELFRVERGGDVTYHGPGQLVGYPILDLHNFRMDVGWYVGALAEVIRRTVADYGIAGTYDPDLPGVWVGNDKVAAIGARIKQWVTLHGFALNVAPNMAHWELIVPCGIVGKGVTAMQAHLNSPISVEDTVPVLARHFGEVFQTEMHEIAPTENLMTRSPQAGG